MNLKNIVISVFGVVFLVCPAAFSGEISTNFNEIPVKGNVTMIDLGAKKCIPCKMMAPIMEKLEKDYQGKADIVFIDVWENREQAQRFRISGIPTQIFFDRDGKEVYRHMGFLDEQSIIKQLESMGVPGIESMDTKKKGS